MPQVLPPFYITATIAEDQTMTLWCLYPETPTHPPLRNIIGKLLEHCLRRRMNHHYCSSLTFRVLLPESCSYKVWVIEIAQEWPSVSGRNWKGLRIKSTMSLWHFMKGLCHLTLYFPYKLKEKNIVKCICPNCFVSETTKHRTGKNRTFPSYSSSALENNTRGRNEWKVGGRRWMEVSVGLATAISFECGI